MTASKTKLNLIAVAVVSGVLILYAVTQLVQAFVLDPSYPLYAEIPQAAGLRENKEVTYNECAWVRRRQRPASPSRGASSCRRCRAESNRRACRSWPAASAR